MEFWSLLYFNSAAKYENLTRASEELNITQPALSRQIRLLEEELGEELFIRKANRRLTLTEAGKRLYKFAGEILKLEREAAEDIRSLKSTFTGMIRIGTSESLGVRIIPELTAAFRKRYPRVTFFYHSGHESEHRRMLEDREMDFFVGGRETPEEGFESVSLPDVSRQGILVKKPSPFETKTMITKDDLRQMKLLVPDQGDLLLKTMDRDQTLWESLYIIGIFNLAETALPVLEQEDAAMFVSEEFARQLDSSRYLFLPLWPEIKYESRLIWKNDNHDQEQLKAFADFVRVFFKRN